ncbi:GyrI-like domain-containing protein [Taibaiella koreensis]|uniref:GyrI-like domain-containing protein n=1 Tax=Taibaiella koreensis TaxID=1268548 RepID=UPI000E599A79|nr:GyrI-like domain-containing protein [Taibaiella koreensis]
MTKIDFTRQYRNYYTAKDRPELIHIEPAIYLSVEGKGDPDGAPFAENIQALYSLAYAIKFGYKAQGADFVVARLEGLWWFDEERFSGQHMGSAPQQVPRSEWSYRLLIRMPETIIAEVLEEAREKTMQKKSLPGLEKVSLYRMHEGQCVQMLHKGPFANEPESLQQMQAFMTDYQLARNGVHHEIYLSDFRKTSPEKLRTILREPVKQA